MRAKRRVSAPLEGNSSVRLPATCVCRRNWLPRRIKRADCGPHGPGDLGNVGLSTFSTGRRRGHAPNKRLAIFVVNGRTTRPR